MMKNIENYKTILLQILIPGKIIPHSNGLRKLRWSGAGQGKRGGSRIIYYWFSEKEIIFMLLIYPKSVQDELTNEQLKILKKVMAKEIK